MFDSSGLVRHYILTCHKRFLNAPLDFVSRRKSKGTIVLGSSVLPSVSRHNLVSATTPAVFKAFS